MENVTLIEPRGHQLTFMHLLLKPSHLYAPGTFTMIDEKHYVVMSDLAYRAGSIFGMTHAFRWRREWNCSFVITPIAVDTSGYPLEYLPDWLIIRFVTEVMYALRYDYRTDYQGAGLHPTCRFEWCELKPEAERTLQFDADAGVPSDKKTEGPRSSPFNPDTGDG